MNDNLTTFLANLRHDIRNHETVYAGSGAFSPNEIKKVVEEITRLQVIEKAALKAVGHPVWSGDDCYNDMIALKDTL